MTDLHMECKTCLIALTMNNKVGMKFEEYQQTLFWKTSTAKLWLFIVRKKYSFPPSTFHFDPFV